MCGFGDDAVSLFDTNVPIAFSCREKQLQYFPLQNTLQSHYRIFTGIIHSRLLDASSVASSYGTGRQRLYMILQFPPFFPRLDMCLLCFGNFSFFVASYRRNPRHPALIFCDSLFFFQKWMERLVHLQEFLEMLIF